MTIGDLIKEKDYDYVSYKMHFDSIKWDTYAETIGCFASKNGKIIPLDGDTYSEKVEVLSYEEWSRPEKGIINGLTVIVGEE